MTLIEMLLAITLFSTLMASAGQLLVWSLCAQAQWAQGLDVSRQVERACRQVEEDVESAQLLFDAPALGAEDRFAIARILQQQWVRIEYRLEHDGSDAWITRTVNQRSASSVPWVAGEPERLLRVTRAAFAFGAVNAQGQRVWTPTWDGAAHGIPRLVKWDCELPMTNGRPVLVLSRAMRNPAGALPTMEPAP